MSELKARHIVDVYDSYYAENPFGERSQVYLKSEADKCIALLKDKANYNEYAYKRKSEELADTCRFYENELRHHKYKRCLAMAKWCEALWGDSETRIVSIRDMNWTPSDELIFYHSFYKRWHLKWNALADKFRRKGK